MAQDHRPSMVIDMQNCDPVAACDPAGFGNSPLPLAKWLRTDVLILLGLFFVLYFSRLSVFSLSIDDEMGALHAHRLSWVLAEHWGVYLVEQFLVPQAVVPFFPIFLFGLSLSISYVLLLRTFGIRQIQPVHYIAFPLYAAFPTWVILSAFTAYIASGGIGQMLTVVALYFYHRARTADNRMSLVATTLSSATALAFAVGMYQSFLFSFLTLGVALEVLALRNEHYTLRATLRRFLLLTVVAIVGGVTYKAVDIGLHYVLHLPYTSYINGFLDWRKLIHSPLAVVGKTAKSMNDVYGGIDAIYGIYAFAFPLVTTTGILALVSTSSISPARRVLLAILAALMLCLPFVINLVSGGVMPTRTLVAVPIVFWFFALLGMTARQPALAVFALVGVSLAALQTMYAANLMQAANHFVRLHDVALAAEINSRIVDTNQNSDSTKTYQVDFYGSQPFTSIYPRPFSTTLGLSFFEWDGGNPTRILNFMRLLGYANLQLAPMEQRQQDLTAFAQMPFWPARDSVRVVGETTLIKLGPTPGYPFNAR